MRRTCPLFVTIMMVLGIATGFTGCATVPPVATLAEGQHGTIVFQSMTLTRTQFLRGVKDGTPAVVSGALHIPSAGTGRLPAVILLHGSWG